MSTPATHPEPDTRGDLLGQAALRLVDVVQELSQARDVETVQRIVRTAARQLVGSDGATFVLRDEDRCFYVDEDAIEPLWKGQRFPLEACISGWCMLNRKPTAIPDIYADDRIPHDAYRPTFVQSLVMVPIREVDPIGAIGNYWASRHEVTPEEVVLLQALANSTAIAMENIAVYEDLERRVADRTVALATANAELERLTLVDELTGLLNRRGFLLLAEQEARLLRRTGRGGVVAFLDVDGLKPLNDRLGHGAGDQLLRIVAEGLQAACRDADLVARLGGDEFAVFLADVTGPGEAVTSRLREAITSAGSDPLGRTPSVSIGIARFDSEDERPVTELLAEADDAMYAEKRQRHGLLSA